MKASDLSVGAAIAVKKHGPLTAECTSPDYWSTRYGADDSHDKHGVMINRAAARECAAYATLALAGGGTGNRAAANPLHEEADENRKRLKQRLKDLGIPVPGWIDHLEEDALENFLDCSDEDLERIVKNKEKHAQEDDDEDDDKEKAAAAFADMLAMSKAGPSGIAPSPPRVAMLERSTAPLLVTRMPSTPDGGK